MRPRWEGIKTLRGKMGRKKNNERTGQNLRIQEAAAPPPPTLPFASLLLLVSDVSVKAADVKSRFHIPIIKVVQSSEWLRTNSRRGRRRRCHRRHCRRRFPIHPSKAADKRENFCTIDSPSLSTQASQGRH